MSWVALDDAFYANPKILAVGLAATGLYARGLAYCGQNLTDGVLSNGAVSMLIAGDERGWDAARALVSHGLWEETDVGFRIHDYLDYNFPRDHVLAKRAAAATRMRELRSREHAANNARSSPQVQRPPSPSPVLSSPDVLPDSIQPPLAGMGGGPGEPKRAAKRRSPARSWPDDFKLTEERREMARCFGLDPATEWNKFKDSALAHDRRYASWDAAWRGWCRNAESFAGRGSHAAR